MLNIKLTIPMLKNGGKQDFLLSDFYGSKNKGYNKTFNFEYSDVLIRYLPNGKYNIHITSHEGWYDNEKTLKLVLPSFVILITLCELINLDDGLGFNRVIENDEQFSLMMENQYIVSNNYCSSNIIGSVNSMSTINATCNRCNIWEVDKTGISEPMLIINANDKVINLQLYKSKPPTDLTLNGYDMVAKFLGVKGKKITLLNDFHSALGAVTDMSIDGSSVGIVYDYTFDDDFSHIVRYRFSDPERVQRFAFSGCSNMEAFVLSDNIISIGDYAFDNCDSLTSVELLNIKGISQYSFYHCSKLESVIFGEHLNQIWNDAFGQCRRLKSITCYAKDPPYIGELKNLFRTFERVADNGVLFYPKGSDYSYWLQDEIGFLGSHDWTYVEI